MDLDLLDATVEFQDARGYRHVAMSDSWKRMCMDLPCSRNVQVPPVYKQQHLATVIDGHEVVIQAWKGHCPVAYRHAPGGIGGEVGIYRKIPERQIPDVLELPRVRELPEALRPAAVAALSRLIKSIVERAERDVELWWPFPELGAELEMRFVHPDRDDELFRAEPSEPRGGYWLSRWMTYGSYNAYAARELVHLRRVPLHAYEYRMEFAVAGHRFRWDDPDSPIVPA